MILPSTPLKLLNAKRCHVRTEAPELSRAKLALVQQELCHQGHSRIAAILGLCRELGLRSREAALLDCQKALTQAREQGVIDIERGTKGGRGKSTATSPSRVQRLVPIRDSAMTALQIPQQHYKNAKITWCLNTNACQIFCRLSVITVVRF